MPKSLRKIQTQIKQKRGASSTALIEDSRDARRLRKGMLRQERLVKSESARHKALQPKGASPSQGAEQLNMGSADMNRQADWQYLVRRFRHFQRFVDSQAEHSTAKILKHIDE
ncbi:hypothetical protein H072_5873 [Dactylellina haptotyla CBS 200.50]|uniref:Uncharacterized protein n=1 Tax=Dactylellina haptotyla (strain CBS 200.50) TaxID=1284197 RepID=S8BLN5_DACHA|nr:hypothetical protein H072_5873 [Dactylellina haptotyla CBS 200.50]